MLLNAFPYPLDFKQDKGIIEVMNAVYMEASTQSTGWWGRAAIDTRMEAGLQGSDTYMPGGLPYGGGRASPFVFNRIKPIVNSMTGQQRRHRKSMTAVADHSKFDQLASDMTQVMMWASNKDGMLHSFSDAFHGSLVTGLNLLQVYMDYRNDPVSGDIRVKREHYSSILIDPFWKNSDLSDCNYVWVRNFLSRQELISLMPDYEDRILALPTRDGSGSPKFTYMAESYGWGTKSLIPYDEFHYKAMTTRILLMDTQTGDRFEWPNDNLKDPRLKEFLAMHPELTAERQSIPTVRVALVVNDDIVIYDGPQPSGIRSYPFVPVYCYYNPQLNELSWKITGIVRGLLDPQYLINHRMKWVMDQSEANNTGWKFKEGAPVDADQLLQQGPGRMIAIKDEAQMSDIEQIIDPGVNPAQFSINESVSEEFEKVSGVSQEQLGTSVDDIAGVLGMLRQVAGWTSAELIFDQADRSLCLLGKLVIEFAMLNFTPAKVANILGREAPQEFYSKVWPEFQITVEQGMDSPTQKQMYMAQLLDLQQKGIQGLEESILEAATIQNKPELMAKIKEQKEKAMKMQEMQMQIQMQEIQSRTQLSRAQAVANEGLGVERLSRVEENRALADERRAQAFKDEDEALLNKVKILKEIETLDVAHLKELVGIAQLLKQDSERNSSTISSQRARSAPQQETRPSNVPAMGGQ